jgi:Zn-finger nucleic acid-binding protein
MKCPKCNVTLLMSEKQGIEIDYCPDCRGIWLDRGELEKIIEKTGAQEFKPEDNYRQQLIEPGRHDDDDDNHDSNRYKYGKKRNFLSELFD